MESSLEIKNNEPKNQQPKKTAAKIWKTVNKSISGWLFVAPAVILMLVFTFYPIVNSLISAFLNDYRALDVNYQASIGFENFRKVIMNDTGSSTAQFSTCLINTLLFAFISVPISTLLALLIAVALNSIKAVQKLYQTVLFLPYLTNSLAMGAVFATFFKVIGTKKMIKNGLASYGIVNDLIMKVFGGNYINWLGVGETWANRFVIIIYEIWAGLPFKILILFSALQSVNKQYYDAAKIDGATKSTTLWKITVPLISPMLSYLLVTGLMGGLKSYSAIVGIFGASMGPASSYEMGTMVGYIYACIEDGATGYAAAGSLLLFAIIMVFTAINLYVSKKKVHY